MNALKISGGLILDFGLSPGGVSDPFLGSDSNGNVVGFASINPNRISAQTANRAAVFTGAGFLTASGVTATELGYLSGAASNIQTQINGLQPLIALTPNLAVISNGSGVLTTSSTTSTEIGYVAGVTSSIQTQLNGKQATITGAATTITSSNLTANLALISNGSGKVAVSAVTSTELGYVSGVTSSLQTQLNGKLSVNLTSPASGDVITFDGANWINSPTGSGTLPTGGSTGQFLIKNSGTNFDAGWHTLVLSDVTNVTSSAAELNLLDGVTTSTVQFNYLNTLTSNVQ